MMLCSFEGQVKGQEALGGVRGAGLYIATHLPGMPVL